MSKLDPILACFVISLEPEAAHTRSLLRSLQSQGVTASLFAAVDGRSTRPPLEAGEKLNDRLAMLRLSRLLTNTELGCYLSHYRVIKQAYDQGCDYVCVLEDDVVLEPRFAETLQALLGEQRDFVRLMDLKIRRRKRVKELVPGIVLTRPERGTLGAQAYLFSRGGMVKFLRYAATIYEAIDGVFDHGYIFGLDTFSVEPHVAYEVERESNIAKTADPGSRTMTLFERLAYHPVKLYFSLRRHWHLKTHYRDYYPATLPFVRPGKSPRLRAKGEAAYLLD